MRAERQARPAFIDLSVTCMGCGKVLCVDAYYPGIIRKIRKKIRKNGWIHHPEDGTLCPECQDKKRRGMSYHPISF